LALASTSQGKTLAKLVDGVIVASAFIRLMESHGLGAVRDLAVSLRAACSTRTE
jgi:tryptophan synthase alpha subunit